MGSTLDFKLVLPHRGFHRDIGPYSDVRISPDGKVISEDEWSRSSGGWLPTQQDHAFMDNSMVAVIKPGKMDSWIAPPPRGIYGKPVEFEYVKFS